MVYIAVTADKSGHSLIKDPGDEGEYPAKIRSLKAGSGIKLVSHDKYIEIKNSFSKSTEGF